MNSKAILLTSSLFVCCFTLHAPLVSAATDSWEIQIMGAPGVVVGLHGQVTLSAESDLGAARVLRFQDTLAEGDVINTQAGAVTEVLLGKAGLLTLQEQSELAVKSRTVLELRHGECEIAVSSTYLHATEAIEVRTPSVTARIHGGIVQITALSTHPRGENHHDGGVMLASTAQLAQAERKSETVHVLEGTAQIIPFLPEAPISALTAGQGIRIIEGMPSRSFANRAASDDSIHLKFIPAISQHAHMSPLAERHLMALQLSKVVDLGRSSGERGATTEAIQLSRLINAMNTSSGATGSAGPLSTTPFSESNDKSDPHGKITEGKDPIRGKEGFCPPCDGYRSTEKSTTPTIVPPDFKASFTTNQILTTTVQSSNPVVDIGSLPTGMAGNSSIILRSKTEAPPAMMQSGSTRTAEPTQTVGAKFSDTINNSIHVRQLHVSQPGKQ